MAIGSVTDYPDGSTKSIVLLAAAVAANGKPAGAVAGLAMSDVSNLFNFMPSKASLILYSNAGSGAMAVTGRLWAYHPSPAKWFPLGVGTDVLKGTINAQSSIGEDDTDVITHQELLDLIDVVGSRIYLEVSGFSGSGTSVLAELVVRRGR